MSSSSVAIMANLRECRRPGLGSRGELGQHQQIFEQIATLHPSAQRDLRRLHVPDVCMRGQERKDPR